MHCLHHNPTQDLSTAFKFLINKISSKKKLFDNFFGYIRPFFPTNPHNILDTSIRHLYLVDRCSTALIITEQNYISFQFRIYILIIKLGRYSYQTQRLLKISTGSDCDSGTNVLYAWRIPYHNSQHPDYQINEIQNPIIAEIITRTTLLDDAQKIENGPHKAKGVTGGRGRRL